MCVLLWGLFPLIMGKQPRARWTTLRFSVKAAGQRTRSHPFEFSLGNDHSVNTDRDCVIEGPLLPVETKGLGVD